MTDAMRESFEAAIKRRLRNEGYADDELPGLLERNRLGDYASVWIDGAWIGWKDCASQREQEQGDKSLDGIEPYSWGRPDNPQAVIPHSLKVRNASNGGVAAASVKPYTLPLYTEAAARAVASKVPEGYALVPDHMRLDRKVIEEIAIHCGDGGGIYGDYQHGILFIGEITDEEGRAVHGLHLACAECEEEGYATLVEFDAVPALGGGL